MLLLLSSETVIISTALPTLKIGMHKTILCVCEVRSRSLKGKHKLQAFENKVLTKIFGPEKDTVNDVIRILHKRKFRYLYRPSFIVRILKFRRLADFI